MYFFDLEDYAGTNREMFYADWKANSGGGGINHCGRPLFHTEFNDACGTARQTSEAFYVAVHTWFTASTVSIGNSTNTLARNIYYNEYIPNIVESQINTIKYFNQAIFTKKRWDSAWVDGVSLGGGLSTSYTDAWAYYVSTPSIYPSTGATTYSIYSANSTTNIGGTVSYTIVHPQFNDWNDSYYYNHNNSLRKVMGSLKRLMKAIDNDDFEEFTL
jgi:hypothetical protein